MSTIPTEATAKSTTLTFQIMEDVKPETSHFSFITSPWQTKCLIINNFLYNCHSNHTQRTYWRCHNYVCYLKSNYMKTC